MSIFYVNPKWQKSRQKKRTGRGTCMHLERNGDGILYFRQPQGSEDFITWHIHPPGEVMLLQRGVGDGMCLPTDIFRKLREYRQLYTLGSKPDTAKKLSTPPLSTTQRHASPDRSHK